MVNVSPQSRSPMSNNSQERPVVNVAFQTTVAESALQIFFKRKPLLSMPKFTLLLTDCDFKGGLWPFCTGHVKKLCQCFPYQMKDATQGKMWSWRSHWSCHQDQSTGPQDHMMNNVTRKIMREKRRGKMWSPEAQKRDNKREITFQMMLNFYCKFFHYSISLAFVTGQAIKV